MAATPTYCATKAAIHSYTQSLRYQLQHTSVEVLELVPPYVQTELLGPQQLTDPNAMPLKEFISETMGILKHSPEAKEICGEVAVLVKAAATPERVNYRRRLGRYSVLRAALPGGLMDPGLALWY